MKLFQKTFIREKKFMAKQSNYLNENHLKFVDEYCSNGLNATQAYLSVYRGSYKNAMASSSRLLRNDKIKKEIDKRLNTVAEKQGITQERLLRHMSKIAFGDITKIVEKIEIKLDKETMNFSYDLSKLTDEERKMIKSIDLDMKQGKIKINGYPADNMQIKLYEMLGYREPEKVEHQGDLNINWVEEKTYEKEEDNE